MAPIPENFKNAPVEVLCMSATPPLIKKGKITCHGETYCEVLLDESEATIPVGTRVIVDGGEETPLRITGQIVEASGPSFRVEPERIIQPDKRDFPRIQGGIHVRYGVVAEGASQASVSAWIDGGELPVEVGDWQEPDPFMDFSGSGLKFEDQLNCKVGDELLMELQVPPSQEVWRATSRVVRIDPMSPVEKDELDDVKRELAPTHQIAIQFIHLPQGATDAISAFMLRIQNALLTS